MYSIYYFLLLLKLFINKKMINVIYAIISFHSAFKKYTARFSIRDNTIANINI